MEEHTVSFVLKGKHIVAVDFVAEDGGVDVGEVDAELVGAAGAGLEF